MLANIKFKAIEDLKMTRAEDYDYNKFLSDSSDDHPKYDAEIESMMQQRAIIKEGCIRQSMDSPLEKPFVIKQEDDDMFYQQAFSQDEVAYALSKVLDESSAEPQYIKVVKDYFFNSGEAVFSNSQIAKDNRDI